MHRNNLRSAATLGFCLTVSMSPLAAQTDNAPVVEFVPLVQPCIDAPGRDTCAEVRAVIRECAEELEVASCDVLFIEPEEVFDTPEKTRAAQEVLQETRDAMPDIFPVLSGDLPTDALEAARADAERTMLRGDENQMTHSQPELQEGELDDAARDIIENNGEESDISEP